MNRISVAALALFAIAALVAPSGAATKGPAAGKTVHIGVIADVTGGGRSLRYASEECVTSSPTEDIKSGKLDAGGANLNLRRFRMQPANGAQVVNLMQKVHDRTARRRSSSVRPSRARPSKAFPIAARANFPVMGTSTTAEGVTAMGTSV